MVVIVTADSNKHQQELDAIWDHLLPAASDDALPANPGAQTSLKEVLSNLRVHPRE